MSSVTHELRTPLTSIRALAELMQDDAEMSAAQRQQFIGIIVAETERLTRLVNQVLDMAKIESGHAEWHVVPVDMRSLVERAVATTAEVFRERAAQVHVHLPDAIPLLHADPDRILQVLLNLLSNAAKFVPSAAGQVQVRLTHDDEGMTVCVQDNGPGVEPGHETMIFDRFHQTDRGAQVAHGTGLGLPISRHIAEHFGGRLWLEPTGQQGACFCFWLPIDAPTSGDTTP